MTNRVMTIALVATIITLQTWANSPPVVSNVTASQQTDCSKQVDIQYDLAYADGDARTVSVLASDNGGVSWSVSVQSATGDAGSSVTPGTGTLVVWDCGVDLPGQVDSFKVRVSEDEQTSPQCHISLVGEVPAGDSKG